MDRLHFVPRGLEVATEALLVLDAAQRDAVQLRVRAHRPRDEASQRGVLQVREVLAGQESDEVSG